MIVCHCRRVNHHKVLEVINEGARSVAEVGAACGAGTGCGGCRASIEALLRRAPPETDDPEMDPLIAACGCRAA